MATPVRKAVSPAQTPAREPVRQMANGSTQDGDDVPTHTPDGRVIARTRSGKIVSRTSVGSVLDEFYIPPEIIPPGWSWEWKNETVLGKSDSAYQAKMQQVGWEPVMLEAHPGVFDLAENADGTPKKGPVRRNGMILMERDIRLTQEAQREEKRKADERLGMATKKHTKLDTSGTHGVDVNHRGVQQNTYARKSIETNIPREPYERMPIE